MGQESIPLLGHQYTLNFPDLTYETPLYDPQMPVSITAYKVFIASPGGLQQERQLFRKIIEDFNEYSALPRGVLFQPIGWEDTLGGMGRPQEIINEDLRICDYFLMMLWDRWGSRPDSLPNSKFSSGTEEEFSVAKECLQDKKKPMRQLAVLFKAVDTRQMSDPGEELRRVITFRKELEAGKGVLYLTFDDHDKFKDILQRYLNRWLMDHEQKKTKIVESGVAAQLPTELSRSSEEGLSVLVQEPTSSLLTKAQQLADAGLLTDAESAFARAVENGTDPQAIAAYGNFLLRLGRLSQAQSFFERLLSTNLEPKWKIIAYAGLGRIHERKNQLSEAEKAFRLALEVTVQLDVPRLRAEQLRNLGTIKSGQGELKEAEAFLLDSLSIFERLEHLQGIAATHNNLGEVYRKRGQLEEAEKHYQESLRLYRGTKQTEGLASVLNNVSLTYRQRRQFDMAEKSLREALLLNEKLGRADAIALNHRNLGDVHELLGEFDRAKHEFKLALEIYGRLGIEGRIKEMETKLNMVEERMQAQNAKAKKTVN